MTDDFRPNDAQRRAIEFGIDRPLKVVAGAGTGKTAVLTHRFVHLVEKHRMRPHRILALTFTKKAAAEMQCRIVDALLDSGLMSRSEAPLLLWIGNFHSICLRLLKQSPLVVGLDPSFAVVEEAEQRLILAEVVNDFLEKKLDTPTDLDSFEDLMIERAEEFVQNVVAAVNRLKSHFITVENLEQAVGETVYEQYRTIERILRETVANEEIHPSTRKKAKRRLESLPAARTHEGLLLRAVYEIFKAYQEKLERQDLLDFNDLIFHAYRLAKTDPAVKKRFDYILVDEFQDTDRGQYRLLKALSKDFANVTIVGDKKQSIYEWREARVENMEEFPGETILLDENYRSFGEILDSANFFISRSMAAERPLRPALNGGRGRAGAAQVKLFRADSREAEAEYMAGEIRHLLEIKRCGPGEIAVLMRSVHASRPYEDALRARGVPYATVGGYGFYDLCETKDLLALLRLVSNPFDDLSMLRVLQSAIVGLSDATLYAICRTMGGTHSSVYDVLKNSESLIDGFRPLTGERLRKLVAIIDELANARGSLTLGELFSELLDRTGYLKYLSSLEGLRGARFFNVASFYRMATSFEERNPAAGLEEFLSYMDAAITAAASASPLGSETDSVQIMTVHQAKGLEFPVVFVVNLGPGAFPLKFRSANLGYDERFGLFARRLPQGVPTVRYEGGYGVGIEERLRETHYLEENRIMYVAMTRAKDLLYLTTPVPKDGASDDFFQLIEEFASEGGGESVALATPVTAAASIPTPEKEAAAHIGIEEIKEIAAEAVQRVSRLLPGRYAPDAGGTIGLSYSRLALFRRCPMKYALRYLYNLPLAPHEESEDESHPFDGVNASLLGTLLHRTLMQYHGARKGGVKADAPEIFAELCRAHRCPKNMVQTGNAMIERYLAAPLSEVETLYEEKEFHWRMEEDSRQIMFEGKVDRVHREGGSLKVVDYKTGMRDEKSHPLQLAMYRLAIESVLGEEDILTSNFYLSTGEEVEYRFSTDELREIRDGIIEDARKIAGGDFGVHVKGEHRARDCADCGYESFCPFKGENV